MQLPIMNFRDVSGYRNTYGEVMRPGKIFRGAVLDRLTLEHVAYMEDVLGIRYILDYRDVWEAEPRPDAVFSKAEYLRIGAMKSGPQPDSARESEKRDRQKQEKKNDKIKSLDFASLLRDPETRAMLLSNQEHLSACYRYMPFGNLAYQAMFERLLKGDGGVYFHCSAGKDRTGLSAMLIMMALGMSEEDMIREYLLSNEYLKDVNDAICKSAGIPAEERERLVPMLGVVEKNIRLSLTAIREQYNSYEAFLENEYGIDEVARQQLRNMYCE